MKGIGRYARECDHEGVEHVIVGDVCLIPGPRAAIEVGYDLHQPRARRYAEALATAAAAEKRIELLIEQVAEHEWVRSQAEQQVDSIRSLFDASMGKLITSADEEPENCGGLIDLYTGQVWVRSNRYNLGTEKYWVKLDSKEAGQTQHEWPIADAGPFLPLVDGWGIDKINRDVRLRDETEESIRRTIERSDDYRDPESGPYSRPDLAPAVARVLTARDARNSDLMGKCMAAEEEVRRLTRLLDRANERINELEPDDLTDDGREGDDR